MSHDRNIKMLNMLYKTIMKCVKYYKKADVPYTYVGLHVSRNKTIFLKV